jgi:hypothetical protein
MRSLINVLISCCIITILLAAGAVGQDEQPEEQPLEQIQEQPQEAPKERLRGKFSLGAAGGIFLPVGSWADHRYAPVKQFTGGFMIEFILEYQVGSWAAFAITGGGGGLGTDEWVNYAWSQNDEITSTARLYQFTFLFRPYVLQRPKHLLKLDFGVGIFAPYGNESFQYFSYEYTFLQDKMSFITGIEYCLFIKPKFALAARANLVYVGSGIKYADEYSQSVMGLPMTIGIRFYP